MNVFHLPLFLFFSAFFFFFFLCVTNKSLEYSNNFKALNNLNINIKKNVGIFHRFVREKKKKREKQRELF